MDRQIITVDIAPGALPTQRLRVSQGDVGRPLGVRVTNNGLPLDCDSYSAFLYVLKPDHNYYEGTCTIADDLITWATDIQETPVAGECEAQIRIMDSDTDIGTARFIEYVEASPADLGYASQSLIASMTEFVDAAERAASEATTAVADVDNVNDVAVDSSGHIVLSKVLGSTVTSDETVLQPGDIENDLLATVSGKVLDATQGKALKDSIDTITGQITSIDTSIGKSLVDRGDITITSADDIKNLSAGMYRISGASTSIFPAAYGVLIIAKGGIYSSALFVPVNSTSHDSIYRRSWNNSTSAWYESDWVANTTTGTIARASGVTGGTLDMNVCKRIGNIITVSARLYGISKTALGNFFVIPAGFRPSFEVWCNGYEVIDGTDGGAKPVACRISTDGTVYMGWSSSATTTQVFFSATYHAG